MAEILVQNFDNWMSLLTVAELKVYTNKYPKFQTKYNSRSMRGDVVEIQDDGFWTVTGRGWDEDHYDLLVVPKLSKAEAREKFGGQLVDEAGDIQKKFKCNISINADINKKQELTEADFKSQVETKIMSVLHG
jgi:hypothetical protein